MLLLKQIGEACIQSVAYCNLLSIELQFEVISVVK